MHVRIKITLLFTFIMSLLLALFFGFIYYFFYSIRLEDIKAHLTNHALTTANMLNEPGTFDYSLMKKIDSVTVIPMKNKTIQVYNARNERIYTNSDTPGDTLHITDDVLNKARIDKKYFLRLETGKPLPVTILKITTGRLYWLLLLMKKEKEILTILKLFCG